MIVLTGHTSKETAYVVESYPYGFRLRCKIRYWVETKAHHGQRVVSQTTNPKVAGEVWNKPKASTYSRLRVLFLDDNGHVQNTGLDIYADDAKIAAFEAAYGPALTDDYSQRQLTLLKAVNVALAKREAERKAAEVPA